MLCGRVDQVSVAVPSGVLLRLEKLLRGHVQPQPVLSNFAADHCLRRGPVDERRLLLIGGGKRVADRCPIPKLQWKVRNERIGG